MGVAVAEAALARGARVTLIAGTMSVAAPSGAQVVEAPTAETMRRAVLAALPGCDALVMAAAVADFRPRAPATAKLARAEGLTLDLEPTADILAEAAAVARSATFPGPRPVLVGFAAETGSLERAVEKAERKGVDLLVANDVSEPGSGFGTETNRVTIVVPGRPPEPWPMAAKAEVAQRLLDRIAGLRAGEPTAPQGTAGSPPSGASLEP
jgi:phosphopantothenoylcysteine decarboxylase/phosphopantothenate--cysteine ligase